MKQSLSLLFIVTYILIFSSHDIMDCLLVSELQFTLRAVVNIIWHVTCNRVPRHVVRPAVKLTDLRSANPTPRCDIFSVIPS